MKYIRTKDGKIFETNGYSYWNNYVLHSELYPEELEKFKKTIIKQADTIEELIDLGDLVGLMITDDYDEPFEKRTRTIREVIGVGINDNEIVVDTDDNDFNDYSSSIVELYFKTQNGDYKLVAKKKSLEGDLELLWKTYEI